MLDHSFADRVALVTGAAGGIGRATARLFAARGARVACTDIDAERLAQTVDQIRSAGGEASAMVADLSAELAGARLVAETVAMYGRLDHAFNNAGVVGSFDDPLGVDSIRRVLAINLEGVIWGMKHQIEHMRAHGGGTIVNTASIAGLSGSAGSMDYAAAKHGVIGFSKTAALKYGTDGVRINVVCPGLIQTAMTEAVTLDPATREQQLRRLSPILHRPGDPNDIAEAVLWLSGPASRFVYGVALPVDGGFMI